MIFSIPTIAVLITCHNRKEKTLKCLSHLYAQKGLNEYFQIEVFLVDDGSTDGTSEEIKFQFPEVNIVQGDGNLYWNRGMRLAWETASASKDFHYYLWLNDDTFLLNSSLNILLVGVKINGYKSIYIGATRSEYNTETSYSGHRFNEPLLNPNRKWQFCDYFNGNIVLISKTVFEIIGMNDVVFHHALGDFDYGLRAKRKNIALYVAPELLGYCEPHKMLPKWCSTESKASKRIIELYKPLGNNPFEFFIFDNRHNGFLNALKHFITIHLRAISPSLWCKLK